MTVTRGGHGAAIGMNAAPLATRPNRRDRDTRCICVNRNFVAQLFAGYPIGSEARHMPPSVGDVLSVRPCAA